MSDNKVKRKPLKSLSGYPYRPARLVPASKDITKRWYIVFYAWDIGKEKLERKRVLHDEFSEIQTLEGRLSMAEGIIEEINYFLKNDWHLFSSPAPRIMDVDFKGYSIIEGLNYAMKYLIDVKGTSKDTVDKYGEVVETVKDFLEWKKLSVGYSLSYLNNAFVQSYFEYIKTERGNVNSTYNYKKGALSTLANVLIDKSPKLFGGVNPFSKIKKLKTQSRKHAAYTDDQLKSIVKWLVNRKQFQVVLFIQFMYYTLARGGKELAGLRVGNIHFDRRMILFRADDAKTDIEEYVGISDRFAQIINESGILKFPQDHYIFSNDNGHGPGQTKVGKNYFYKRITEAIEDLGLYNVNPNFTPYGVKHTGAIALYLATKNINTVMLQCRHQDLETTIKYLRDLGVFTDFFGDLNKLKGAI